MNTGNHYKSISSRLCAILCALSLLSPVNLAVSGDKPESAKSFCQATGGYRLEFPRDHFSHPCYKTEWWYFTGNLSAKDGHRFGFEVTFFREGVENPYSNPSRWRVDDLYLAHFAISDLGRKKFYYTQRLNRAGIDLAGADQKRGRVWNGDWFAELDGATSQQGVTSQQNEKWRIEAADGGNQVQLDLLSRKAPVLQGNRGLSQKSAGSGNASYYYSLTHLETSGRLQFEGASYEITGLSWMDHEFFTGSLQPSQLGWDWVSLQMEDGTEWMLYRFRSADGSRDPYSSGTFVSREGRVVNLAAKDFEMQPLKTWHSASSGATYPIAWHITIPRLGVDIEISAAMQDQELVGERDSGLTYWEGSIDVQGMHNQAPVHGRGYLEMTGYAAPITLGLKSQN